MNSLLKSIGSAIGGVAPVLANALLPGVGSVVANAAVSAVAKGLGLDEKATADVVNRTLQGPLTGEQIAGLRKESMEFQARMKELDIDLERIHADDRDSARKMYQRTKNMVTPFLGGFSAFAEVAIVAYVIYRMLRGEAVLDLSGEAGLLIGGFISSLSNRAQQVYNFYFGSSKTESESRNQANTKEA